MPPLQQPPPDDAPQPGGTRRRNLLGLITASLALGIVPDALLAEAAYGATPRWNRPFTSWIPITSPFGWRVDPLTGESRHHNGTDYSATGSRRTD